MLLSSGGTDSYGLNVTYEGKDSRQKIKMVLCQLKGNSKWTIVKFVHKDNHLIENINDCFLYSEYNNIGLLIESKKLYIYNRGDKNKVWRLSKKVSNVKELKSEFLEFLTQMEKRNLVTI